MNPRCAWNLRFAGRAGFFLCWTLVVSRGAHPMFIAKHESVIAWSTDGSSCLLEISEDGPEGGGRLADRVVLGRTGYDQTWAFSSDFSPGNGSTPQAIPPEACAANAAAMQSAMAAGGFAGVTVDSQYCHSGDRSGIVRVSSEVAKAVPPSEFAKVQGRLAHGDLILDSSGNNFILENQGRPVITWPRQRSVTATSLGAALSPRGRLLLIFSADDRGERLIDALYSPAGDPQQFKPLRRKP